MYVCTVCGHAVPETKGRGRKRSYCSDNCADVEKFRVAMTNRLAGVAFTAQSRKLFRGELMILANSLRKDV